MKKMIRLLSFLLALTMLVPVAGCKKNEITEDTLVVWCAGLDVNYEQTLVVDEENPTALYTKYIVDEFEKRNEGKKLKLLFQGWGEDLNKAISNALITNIQVDVVPGEQYLKKLIDGETFEPLDDKYRSVMSEDLLERGMYNDKLYAVPSVTGTFALWINKRALRNAKIIDKNDVAAQKYVDAGIDPLKPATMEDLLTICRDIKEYYTSNNVKGKGGYLLNDTTGDDSQWRALAFMRQAGGDFANDDGTIAFNENELALQMMYDLGKTGPEGAKGIQQTDDQLRYFYEAQAAYVVDGSNVILNSRGTLSENDIIGVELPVFKDKNIRSNVSVGSVYYGIMATSKKKDLAVKFIELMMSEDVQRACLRLTYGLPTLKTVLNDEAIKTDEYHYDTVKPLLAPLQNGEYTNVKCLYGFTKNASLIWDAWKTYVNRVYTTDKAGVTEQMRATHEEMVECLNR